MRSREHLLSPREYRLITTDIIVFGTIMLGMIALAVQWAEPNQRDTLWLLLAGSSAALGVGLAVWIGNRARLQRRDTPPPPWWQVAAVSMVSIGPAMFMAGALGSQELPSWLATPIAVACWLLIRTFAGRLLERHNDPVDAMPSPR